MMAYVEGTTIECIDGEWELLLENPAEAAKSVDVVVMEIGIRSQDGFALAEKLIEAGLKVVVLSIYDNPTYLARCKALGVYDYILKGSPRQEVLAAIQNAHANGDQTSKEFRNIKTVMADKSRLHDGALTPRESQVLRHVALGMTNKDIASSLGISVETVKEHVQKILRTLGVNDRTQAAVWAVRKGIV